MRRDDRGDDVLGQLASLRRYARSLAQDEAQAEDLVHDALVRAYEHRSTFRTGGVLRTWLFAILHNVFIDGRRQRASELRREEESARISEPALPPGQEGSTRLRQIHAAFVALPPEQRAALHLVTIEGLSYQEAAGALDIPVGTLMSRLGRARAALRAFEALGPARLPALPAPAQPVQAPALPPASRPNLRVVGGADD